MFYPEDSEQCREEAGSYLRPLQTALDHTWIGGIVPHAGWICSGAIAGQAIATIARTNPAVDVVVVFGAIHTPLPTKQAVLDTHSRWAVPGGQSDIPQDVSAGLLELKDFFCVDERFHSREHAVEVELPLIQQAWPTAAVLPVEVPAFQMAAEIGRRTAEQLVARKRRPNFLASSDLTHYGPSYGFTPWGVGPMGLHRAKENDDRLLRLVTTLSDEAIVPEVLTRANACGGGAIAAMIAACKVFGATRAKVLRHANSFETLAAVAPQPPTNAVGYAGVVVG